MSISLRVSALAAALLLVACTADQTAAPPPGHKVQVSQEIMDFYKQKYLPEVGAVNEAAFAVSESGRSAGLSYCPDLRCKSGGTVGQDAIHQCASSGEKCYIFALGSAILVDYEVVP
ncbi:MAG TPA: hypothetical protein VM639_03410 [Dongiaceae bacterium]|nr:hypothetical protein [Dongiaceae bacterium]